MDLKTLQRVGIAAAYKGAQVIQSFLGHTTEVRKKGPIDLVTEADLGSEKAIIETIRSKYPDHTIIAEESGLNSGADDCRWIIDPLDGTTNFAHGLSLFAVSIAFAQADDILLGIVLNPATGELFTAQKGSGTQLNGHPISVSDTRIVKESLLVTGFPYNANTILAPLMHRFAACLGAAQGIRRLGSAALDLCWVACGRFDGFWEQNLKPWDTAAGVLIAREAGARITDFCNRPFSVDQKELLATNGHIHEEMLGLLASKESA